MHSLPQSPWKTSFLLPYLGKTEDVSKGCRAKDKVWNSFVLYVAFARDTFQLLQGLSVTDVNPHGCQLFFSQVNLLNGSLVLGQFVYKRLGLTQRKQCATMTNLHNIQINSNHEHNLFHKANFYNNNKVIFNLKLYLAEIKTVLLTTNSATILDRRYALDSTGALGKWHEEKLVVLSE